MTSKESDVADAPHGRVRPPGQTTGTPERPAQHLDDTVLTFDLNAAIEQLHHEEAWRQGSHNAMTLTKGSGFRVVLVAMKDGARLATHQTPAPISIQTLTGNLRLHLPDRAVDLLQGHLVTLAENVPHDVEARGESAFLLTVPWHEAVPVADEPASATG